MKDNDKNQIMYQGQKGDPHFDKIEVHILKIFRSKQK